MRTFILGAVRQREFWGGSIWVTFFTMCRGVVHYLKSLLFPVNLSAYHDFPLSHSFFEYPDSTDTGEDSHKELHRAIDHLENTLPAVNAQQEHNPYRGQTVTMAGKGPHGMNADVTGKEYYQGQ